MSDSLPDHEEIARCAYAIYLQEGCPPDRALDHWLEAQEQLTVDKLYDAFAGQAVAGELEKEQMQPEGASTQT
ncbi:MAG: DUF2934 domain-containing protein [Verrucomicrobiota bacterium]